MGSLRFLFTLTIIIVIALTMSSIARSDDWVCYFRDKSKKECRQYYDQKMQYTKDVVKVATKLPITDEIRKTITSLNNSDSHMIISKMFDCKNETVSVIKTTVYKTDGTVSSFKDGVVSVKHQIDPDSRDGALFEIVCKNIKKRMN